MSPASTAQAATSQEALTDRTGELRPRPLPAKRGRSGRPWREAPNFLAAGILLELKASLKPGGVLFSSNSRGHNEEGWSQGRYGAYHDLDAWRRYMSVAGFVELNHYYRPAGVPRERQSWLASVWRRLQF